MNEFEVLDKAINELIVSVFKSIEPFAVYLIKKLTELIIYLEQIFDKINEIS